MKHLLIRHKVADFAKWKKGYNAHAPARRSAGLQDLHLLRSIEDSNEVVLLFSVASVAKAKALISSAEMRLAMKNAGVIGKPDLVILK